MLTSMYCMTLKLQLEDDPAIAEKKKALYQDARYAIYSRIPTKRDVIRKLGFALKELGVPEERIAATIANELLHPAIYPDGSRSVKKDSKGNREDISGQPVIDDKGNPLEGKSMVHPDYARRNLPEYMKDYSQWRGKENLDKSIQKNKPAKVKEKVKEKKASKKNSNGVDYDFQVKKRMEELDKAAEKNKKKQPSGSTQETPKEENIPQVSSTSTTEPSDNTSVPKPTRRRKEAKAKRPETVESQIPEIDADIAELVVDNSLFPSQKDERVEQLENENVALKTEIQRLSGDLTKITELYDRLVPGLRETKKELDFVKMPFKEKKWVKVILGGVNYILCVSYKADPVTRRLHNEPYKDETRLLLPDELNKDVMAWKKMTNGRWSLDLKS